MNKLGANRPKLPTNLRNVLCKFSLKETRFSFDLLHKWCVSSLEFCRSAEPIGLDNGEEKSE